MKILLVVACCALSVGCTIQERTGPLQTAPPESSPMKYRIISTVEATGSSSVISPSLFMPALIHEASEKAVGQAIYERDDIDIVLNPKKKISVTSYFLWATAEVTIKGRGAAFEQQ